MPGRLHFKISANTIMLKFFNTLNRTEIQLLCNKSESLSDVVDRLLKRNFIDDTEGFCLVCTKNECELDMDALIDSLNLRNFDIIKLEHRRTQSDGYIGGINTMTILYGCPSSMDLHGIIPNCMDRYFEDFNMVFR